MTDRENVVQGLEKCKRCECDDCTEKGASQAPWDCPAYDDFVDSAIAMLKEQPEIVRCGECKYYSNGFCYNPNTFDSEKTCGNTVPDWFCADGERRNQDEDES